MNGGHPLLGQKVMLQIQEVRELNAICKGLSFLVLVLISSPVCTWAVYFLTTSEDVQQNLYKEMDRVLGKGPITHEKIEQLRWVPWKELQRKLVSRGGDRGFVC